MILSKFINADNRKVVCLQFGLGLVGKAIYNSLKANAKSSKIIVQEKINWEKIESVKPSINKVNDAVVETYTLDKNIDFEIIWSAGKVGVSSIEDECENELRFFKESIQSLLSQLYKFNNLIIHFILISSAGGLFEGQSFINKDAKPTPKRPYRNYKLAQKKFLSTLVNSSIESKIIYRPSSVFSIHNNTGRKGLLTVLFENDIIIANQLLQEQKMPKEIMY